MKYIYYLILLLILTIVIVSSCVTHYYRNDSEDKTITIYGKVWGSIGDVPMVVHTPSKYQLLYTNNPNKVVYWPDSMQFQYVKVTGVLKLNRYKPDTINTHKQQGYIKYFIIKPHVELIHDDSTICAIDSVLGRCVEMRRFYNRLQIDRVLDSLVEGDSIYTVLTDYEVKKPSTASFFKYNGSKTFLIYTYSTIHYDKIPEYFIIRNFSCVKGSKYDIELTHVRIIKGVKTEKKYLLSGDYKKVNLISIEQ